MDYKEVKTNAAKALAQIDPKQPLGAELFEAVARVSISLAHELVALRQRGDQTEVLLLQRGPNEVYPSLWHCPGSVLRPGETENDVFNRLAQGKNGVSVISRDFIGRDNNPGEVRGHFYHLVFLCEVDLSVDFGGRWFSIDNLPETTLEHHREVVIPMAVKAFRER